jgi:hypothetical protein
MERYALLGIYGCPVRGCEQDAKTILVGPDGEIVARYCWHHGEAAVERLNAEPVTPA